MTKLHIAMVLLAAPITAASAGVTTSATAPTGPILSSMSAGTIDTALFDEQANGNHARGQLFALPDGAGTAFEITAVTIKKSTDQTYANDALTLRIFQGTQAQWDTGTGHSTATDGTDYLVDTTVTLLHTETFNLNGAFSNNHYVTFELTTPLVVNEDADFGFLMTYDQASGSNPDRFRHREGSTGGRTSITTSEHSTTTSRHIVYFVHGTATSPSTAATLAVNSTPPGAGPVSHATFGSYTRTFGTSSANPYYGRGQTFTTADTGDANTQWSVTELAVRAKAEQTFGPGDTIRLWVMKWNPDTDAGSMVNWTTGDGLSDGDLLNGTGMSAILVNGEQADLPASVSTGQYYHFQFDTPLVMDENAAYAAFFEFVDADGGTGATYVELGIGSSGSTYPGGTQLRTTGTTHDFYNQDLTFFVTGTRIAGPVEPVLELASPFQDGMVLQRGKPVAVWGWADPSTAVSVMIDGTVALGTSDEDGAWNIALPALAAGGPHQLVVASGIETNILDDVLVGDVWITFGQSNMVRPLSEMTGASTYINDITGNNLPIRCLKIAQRAATSPEETGSMTWLDNSNPGAWTSVGTVFAHQMHQATGVPTAIIWAAWGSTSIECWMPAEMTATFPHFADIMADYYANDEATVEAMLNGTQTYNEVWVRQRPHIVYNQMMHPLLSYGISGFVWYQGEANTDNLTEVAQYGFTLPGLVAEYRRRFGQGDLPFLGVQLPSYNKSTWPWFRESQNQLSTVNNGHVAVTIDTGLAGNIHPYDKEPIGIRLSRLARKYVLGESIEAHGPRYATFSVDGGQVTVGFTQAAGLTTDDALAPATFELAGADQVFHAATSAAVSGTDVILSSISVPAPVAVRYAWSAAPVNQVNLVNSDDLPAAPFRSDTWAIPGLGPQAPQSVDDAYEIQMNQPLHVPASGVLENDMDLNHDSLSAARVSDVSFGTLSLLADGSFTYTPDTGYAGPDQFTYRCSDDALDSPEATVRITVLGQTTAYYSWKATIAWQPGDDESENGDPDHDGMVNFLEFALGLNPLVADRSGLPFLTVTGRDVQYVFNNAQPGVLYEVLLSSDLETWSDPPYAVLTSESPTPVPIPSTEETDGSLFVTLRVSE